MLDEEKVPRLFPSFTQDNYHPSEVLASLGVIMPVTESPFSNILHGLCSLYVLQGCQLRLQYNWGKGGVRGPYYPCFVIGHKHGQNGPTKP